jgi:energy-coupling factor transporter ATP-binding protein EcfA2
MSRAESDSFSRKSKDTPSLDSSSLSWVLLALERRRFLMFSLSERMTVLLKESSRSMDVSRPFCLFISSKSSTDQLAHFLRPIGPLGTSFQRTTGYVSQMDIHEPTQTIREALIFSALLRQPAEVPEEEKIAYVDKVIDLLELTEIQNAIIGENNVGLGVEARKRLTIGCELVAKPVLLFLDEVRLPPSIWLTPLERS